MTCSMEMDMQHGHASWTSRMDMGIDMDIDMDREMDMNIDYCSTGELGRIHTLTSQPTVLQFFFQRTINRFCKANLRGLTR
jgi:hypothetical protein